MPFCAACFEKQRTIDELTEENLRLKAQLNYRQRQATEGFFGSATPSSKKPVKSNAETEKRSKKGGGKIGHKGHGRSSLSEAEADRVERIPVDELCPECGAPLEYKGTKNRSVADCAPVKMQKILYKLEVGRCPRCRKKIIARAPGVLPRFLYGNQLLAHVAVQHYFWGNTLGQIEKQTGIGYGSLVDAMHQLARRLEQVCAALIAAYRLALVKHADETGWRTDGHNGYAWLFCTNEISIFRVRDTRSARVAIEVLGTDPLPGTLVVDRYAVYNKSPSALQYCYTHLKRDVEGIEEEFPQNTEIAAFVGALAPQIAAAITLRTLNITDRQYYEEAAKIKNTIIRSVESRARHPGIHKIQDIFRRHPDRLYRWADDRSIPADNNLAERELRPLVIARKISYGSQSEAGAKTRETIMTVLHSLKKRTPDSAGTLKAALDQLALNPALDLSKILFGLNTPKE
jgi:transposase